MPPSLLAPPSTAQVGQGIYLDTQATNACVNNNTFGNRLGLAAAISANSSGDQGFG